MGIKIDLLGLRFGRLLVESESGVDGRGEKLWKCKCDCGSTSVVLSSNLRTGHTKSCGCFNNETRIRVHTKHGMSKTLTYKVWQAMHKRCENEKGPFFKYYGGRGIEFRFKNFAEFIAEVGPRPNPKMQLDRIDNEGHYEIGNIQWTTKSKQITRPVGKFC